MARTRTRSVYLPDRPVITMERMIQSSYQCVAEVTASPAAVAQAGYFSDEFVFDAAV